MDQPGEHLGRAIGAVGAEPLGIEPEAVLDPLDHGPRRPNLRLPDGAAGLDVDNDGVVEVDQVVRRVGEEGLALVRAGPLRGRIRPRDELWRRRARRAPGSIVERVEVLADRTPGRRQFLPVDFVRAVRRALPVGVGPDQAGIDRAKPSPPTSPSAMQRRTIVSNSLRSRSLSRKRPWRFFEKVE
jgi:hypothetical protein